MFGQGQVGSGTAERQKSMKTMSDEAIYHENFGFRKTNMLSATSPLVRATNSKLLGTKILEVSKTFRV